MRTHIRIHVVWAVRAIALVVLCATVSNAQSVLYRWSNVDNILGLAAQRNQRPMTGIGDVDGDGVSDLLIGRPLDSTLAQYAGRADVVSGRDGTLIRSVFGTATTNSFGATTAALDDVDGDGVADFAIGAPYLNCSSAPCIPTYVRIISGRTGALLHHIDSTAPFRHFGLALRRTPDVDGDGVGELLIGGPSNEGGGTAAVVDLVSCTTGTLLREWTVAYPSSLFNGSFGQSVDAIGDINGDGITEIIVGSMYDDVSGEDAGSARIYSAATGAQVAVYLGSASFEHSGAAVAGLGDVDGDSVADFAVASLGSPNAPFAHSRVDVRSGATGAALYAITDPGMMLGWTIEPMGDEDADTVRDFVIYGAGPVYGHPNYLRLVSGRTGATLFQIDGTPELPIGRVLVDGGDVNRDGHRDLLVSRFDLAPPYHTLAELVLLGVEPSQSYCTAKTNSLGCVPTISSSSAASLSVGDNFVVSASNVLNHKVGVLLWSANSLSTPFCGGTLCVSPSPPSIRGPVLDSGGSPANVNDCSGSYSFHFSHALMNSRGLTAGMTLYAQFLSRDDGFAPPRNIGLTDALRFVVVP